MKKLSYYPIIKRYSDDNKRKCWQYLKNHNWGNRGKFDGNKEAQFVGLIGETEAFKLLKCYYPDLYAKADGFDGGVDIFHNGQTIDVKTMARTYRTWHTNVANFSAYQVKSDCDVLLFCSINKSSYQIEFCGWIYKVELKSKADFHKKGSVIPRGRSGNFKVISDLYEVKHTYLRNIRELLTI